MLVQDGNQLFVFRQRKRSMISHLTVYMEESFRLRVSKLSGLKVCMQLQENQSYSLTLS